MPDCAKSNLDGTEGDDMFKRFAKRRELRYCDFGHDWRLKDREVVETCDGTDTLEVTTWVCAKCGIIHVCVGDEEP